MRRETTREVVHAGRSTPIEAPHEITPAGKFMSTEKNGDSKKCKSGDHRRSLDAYQKEAKSLDQRVPRPPPSKYNNFTGLTMSHEDVFLATEHIGVYKRPDSMRGDRLKRNQNKYCRFHRDIGHTTEECIALKDEIEKLIQDGYLQNYVRNEGAKPHEDEREVGPHHEIRTIFDGPHFTREMQGAQNRYLRGAREDRLRP